MLINKQKFQERILVDQKLRMRFARWGARLNKLGYKTIHRSRGLVRFMNHHLTDADSDWFVHDLAKLHRDVDEILERQTAEYGNYYYFYGYPYQSLGIVGIYGERSTEERFEVYDLASRIGRQDRLLDLGCNCGFMGLYTAFRTGCTVEGIDINPFMIEIGRKCTAYLRLSDRVKLHATKIQDFRPEHKYTVIFSFATHWTDDEKYQVPLRQHLELLRGLLEDNGLLIFETHCADVGDDAFYKTIDEAGDLFDSVLKKDTDRGERHLYILKALPQPRAGTQMEAA